MTTQTAYATLSGPDGSVTSAATTATDDTWTEMKDETGALSLYQVFKGKVVNGFSGNYAAGGGAIRVRNSVTNEVKGIGFLALAQCDEMAYFEKPFVVQDKDVLEVYTVVSA